MHTVYMIQSNIYNHNFFCLFSGACTLNQIGMPSDASLGDTPPLLYTSIM